MPPRPTSPRVVKHVLTVLDGPTRRSLIVESNDGIIATAGVVEGFAGAGWTGPPLVLGALFSMVAGGLALGGMRYAEEEAERDARRALIAEEREQLARSPQQELEELAEIYEAKGLSAPLAWQVALELSARDPLAAHIEAEHQFALGDQPFAPLIIGLGAALAYALGAAIPLLAVLLAPDEWRGWVTVVAAAVGLILTSILLARMGVRSIRRSTARTLAVAGVAGGMTLLVGWLLDV